jgi:redox-sensing transcriptional repressor
MDPNGDGDPSDGIDGWRLDVAEMVDTINETGVQIAMIAVPADHAQEIADELAKTTIKAILNYATICINVPEGVRVQYIDPATHLQWMTYYLDE